MEKGIFIPNYLKCVFVFGQGAKTLSEYGKMLSLTQTNLSRLCSSLEKEGIIEFKKLDGKQKMVYLTERGTQLMNGLILIFTALKITDKDIYNPFYIALKEKNKDELTK